MIRRHITEALECVIPFAVYLWLCLWRVDKP
jgi:hypothetical protein